MIKSAVFVMALFCSATFLAAQEAHPVIVIASDGKITYQSSDTSEAQKIATGAVLKSNGILTLNKKESATLFCNGQFRQVEGDQTTGLNTIFPETDGLVRLNFDRTFGEYVSAAINMAANPENPQDAWTALKTTKGTGDGWSAIKTKGTGDGFASIKTKGTGDGWSTTKTKGTGDGWTTTKTKGTGDGFGTVRTKGTGDGWGGKGAKIHPILPYGKVLPGKRTFQWSKPEGNPQYKLEIRNSEGAVIVNTLTQDTFLVIEPDTAAFKPGDRYEWMVTVAGDTATTSDALFFEIGEAATEQEALQSAQKAPLYQQSTEEVRILLQAVALEQDEWYEEASRLYQNLQKSESKNNLIRLMHAAFWMRQGLKPLAEKAFSGK